MSLQDWLKEGTLKPHKTSTQEIDALLKVVARDIADASIELLSEDRRFATAYNAGLQLATVALLVSGYRPSATHGHHWITIQSLQFTLGSSSEKRRRYLNACRKKRNQTDYDRAGEILREEVEELLAEVKRFREEMILWLKENHPEIMWPE